MQSALVFSLDSLVTLSFLVFLVMYIIFSAVLHYHWKTYSIDERINKLTLTSYYSLTLVLLAIMGIIVIIL